MPGLLRIALAALIWLAGLSFAAAQGTFPVSVPVYGNWCGPAYPASLSVDRPPVDPLDAACMRHDYCTAANGIGSCGCDIGFMSELRTTRWDNPVIWRNARAIYDAIAVIPCNSPSGTAAKLSLFTSDMAQDAIYGALPPLAVPDRWRMLFFGN